MAEQKGFIEGGAIRTGVKAGQIIDWLKADFDLGRGHAMAVYALLKGRNESPAGAARSSRTKK